MKMLEAGGLEVITDNERKADEDNPKGYYEFERAKRIREDVSWLPSAVGKVFKLVSSLLVHLPDQFQYRIIFMKRNLREVVASQNKMLKRQEKMPSIDDSRLLDLYQKHLQQIERYLTDRTNARVTYVSFNDCIVQPEKVIEVICRDISRPLDAVAMASAVEPALYRNRTLK